MAIFDTPITSNDSSIHKILKQKLPVILYLYNRPDATLDTMLNTVAKEYVGKLLVARIDVSQNPEIHAHFQRAALPAIIALKEGERQSQSSPAQASDVKAHADFLLGQGPKPKAAPTSNASNGSQQAPSKPVAVSDGSFKQDVLQSKIPVLVDFWAPWCGPCRTIAPSLETLAGKYAGQVKIAKLNVDDNPQTSSQYRAMSIPMLILFKDGKPVNQLVGAHPLPSIERLIQSGL